MKKDLIICDACNKQEEIPDSIQHGRPMEWFTLSQSKWEKIENNGESHSFVKDNYWHLCSLECVRSMKIKL